MYMLIALVFLIVNTLVIFCAIRFKQHIQNQEKKIIKLFRRRKELNLQGIYHYKYNIFGKYFIDIQVFQNDLYFETHPLIEEDSWVFTISQLGKVMDSFPGNYAKMFQGNYPRDQYDIDAIWLDIKKLIEEDLKQKSPF